MSNLTDDKKTIKELQIWTWTAIIMPATTIFGIVILWSLGLSSQVGMFIIISAAAIIGFATIWWWWAISVVGHLVKSWSATQQHIEELIAEVHEVRELILQARQREELIRSEYKKHTGESNA